MKENFFEQLLAIMTASLIATILLHRLRLPNIIAYLLAGAIVGPNIIGWVDRPDDFTFLAEFGVVFLLFSLGLEFSLPKLIALRKSVFGLGGAQVTICTGVFGFVVWLWGTSMESAIIIAGALALSSTAIVTKELAAERQIHSRHGQLSIGILLFQDLTAIVFLILIPVLASNESQSLWLLLGTAAIKGSLLLIILLSVGKWVLPLLYNEVARTHSEEVFVLSTLVIILLASWITHSFGLSMTLGSFAIGMMLGESHFRHQINADIRALKDILLGLFFVTIGMRLELQLLVDYWPQLLLYTAGLIAIKTILISFLAINLGETHNASLKSGLNLAQAGEFGLALLALGVMHEILPAYQGSFIMIVVIFSMASSPFLIRHSDKIISTPWLRQKNEGIKSEMDHPVTLPQDEHVIIGGLGRVGKTIARLLDVNNIEYIAIDLNNELISQERKNGYNVIYGDCTRKEILTACHLPNARLAILTFRTIDLAKNTLEHIRASGVKVPVIIRCHEHGDLEELISLGADHVVPEMLESSLLMGVQVLNILGVSEFDIEQQIAQERENQLN